MHDADSLFVDEATQHAIERLAAEMGVTRPTPVFAALLERDARESGRKLGAPGSLR